MKHTRNINYDLMRLIGLFVIMVAHSAPPGWIFQLRNFGTPLLVIGSALTYSLIYSNRKIYINKYLKKRLGKLILPTWIFLTIFFLCTLIIFKIFNKEYPFTLTDIIGSYALMDGIGFVWVLKIYVILALATPFLVLINRKITNNTNYFLLILATYICYELLIPATKNNQYINDYYLNSILFIIIPYTIIYAYGFRISRLRKTHIVYISIISFLIFTTVLIHKYLSTGEIVQTQKFKYPPTIYYLSYAFFSIHIIYLFINYEIINPKIYGHKNYHLAF